MSERVDRWTDLALQSMHFDGPSLAALHRELGAIDSAMLTMPIESGPAVKRCADYLEGLGLMSVAEDVLLEFVLIDGTGRDRVFAFLNLARLRLDRNELPKAEVALESARELLAPSDHEATAYHDLLRGHVLLHRFEIDGDSFVGREAIRQFRSSAQSSQQAERRVNALLAIAETAAKINDLDQAIDALVEICSEDRLTTRQATLASLRADFILALVSPGRQAAQRRLAQVRMHLAALDESGGNHK